MWEVSGRKARMLSRIFTESSLNFQATNVSTKRNAALFARTRAFLEIPMGASRGGN